MERVSPTVKIQQRWWRFSGRHAHTWRSTVTIVSSSDGAAAAVVAGGLLVVTAAEPRTAEETSLGTSTTGHLLPLLRCFSSSLRLSRQDEWRQPNVVVTPRGCEAAMGSSLERWGCLYRTVPAASASSPRGGDVPPSATTAMAPGAPPGTLVGDSWAPVTGARGSGPETSKCRDFFS